MVKQFFTERRHRKWWKKTIFLLPSIDYFACRSRLKLLVFPKPNLKYWMILFHCVIIPICCRHAYESNVDTNYCHCCNYSVTIFIFSPTRQKLILNLKSSFSYLTGVLYHKCFYSYFCIIHKNRAQWWFELFHHTTICSFTRANGHITLKAPVLVRSPQLSNVESGQYLDGWPPGNTRCCWLFVTHYFSDNNYVFWHFFSSEYFFFATISAYVSEHRVYVRKNQHLGGKLDMILPLSLANVKHIIKFVITMHIITNLYVII